MSYPKKITRETILQAALSCIERDGVSALSMRTLAADLGVTPNALYRYFANKAALEYAMADEAGRILLGELERGIEGLPPLQALQAMGVAYLRFARQYPALYMVKMSFCKGADQEPESHTRIWALVQGLMASVSTIRQPDDLALSMWAYLHGVVELDRMDLLEGRPMEDILAAGFSLFMAGLAPSR